MVEMVKCFLLIYKREIQQQMLVTTLSWSSLTLNSISLRTSISELDKDDLLG